MGTWAKSLAEGAIAKELAARGVRVTGTARRGGDLEVRGEGSGRPYRVIVLGASAAASRHAGPAPDPCFVRVDVGEPEGSVQRWGLWQELVWGTSRTPFLDPVTVQALSGPGWLSVAGGFVPDLEGAVGRPAVDLLFKELARLEPWSRVGGPRDQDSPLEPDLTFASWGQGANETRRARRMGAGIVLVGALAGCVGLALAGLPGVGVTVALGGAVAAGTMLTRVPRGEGSSPASSIEQVIAEVRSGQPFDRAERAGAEGALPLPVLVEGGPLGRELGTAVVGRTELVARSGRHGMALRLALWDVRWPPGTMRECQVVPSGWVSAEISGHAEDLALAPRWRREVHREASVRWLLTLAEVEAGALSDLLQGLAGALRAGRGAPYRD